MTGFLGLDELFEGRHFDREVIVLCVRWYLRFKLSYRDLVEMMAGLGLLLRRKMQCGYSSCALAGVQYLEAAGFRPSSRASEGQ